MKENQIVDIDGFVHVVNGKVICFKPDAVIVKIVVSKSWFFGYMFHLGWQMLPRDKTSCQYQDKLLCKY